LQHRRLLRVDLAARAREHTTRRFVFTMLLHVLVFRFRSHRVAPSRASDRFGSFSTRQWIAFPRDPSDALPARRHSCGDLGELGRLLSRGVQRVALELRGRVGASRWRPRSIDRCLQLTDVVFKDDRPKSRRTSHRHVPT
jgi:hypothetical protein